MNKSKLIEDIAEHLRDFSSDTHLRRTMFKDWRNYVPDELLKSWKLLTIRDRMIIASVANVAASNEEWY